MNLTARAFLFLIVAAGPTFGQSEIVDGSDQAGAAVQPLSGDALTSNDATTAQASVAPVTDGITVSQQPIEPTPLSVTYSGSFTYSYPIKLPPGTNGVAPQLSIKYNSSDSNGILGVGFALDGLSVIERDPSYPIRFGSQDHYMLDGEKLSYKSSDKTFHPERETYDKIQAFYNTDTGTAVANPNDSTAFWVVRKKDGTAWYYGNYSGATSDSNGTIPVFGQSTPRLWALSKVVDANGNFYSINYTCDRTTGAYYPKVIVYTRATGINHCKAIQFTYENRTDHAPQYLPSKVDLSQRLKWITVLTHTDVDGNHGTLVRKYRLDYNNTTSPSQQSELSTIQEYGSDGAIPIDSTYTPLPSEATLPPTTFAWSAGASYTVNTSPARQGNSLPTNSGTPYVADLNGDGYQDMLIRYTGSMSVFKGSSTGALSAASWTIPSGITLVGPSTDEVRLADVNGDGRPDLVVVKSTYSDQNTHPTQPGWVKVYLNSGSGFDSAAWSSNASRVPYGYDFCFGDLDGDGVQDLLVYSPNPGSTTRAYLGDKTTGGFTKTEFTPGVSILAGDSVFLADMDGDKKDDWIVVANSTNTQNYHPPTPGWVFTKLSTGTSFSGTSWNSSGNLVSTVTGDQPVFADINGDRKADLVVISTNSVSCRFSDGAGFGGPAWSSTSMGTFLGPVLIADLNGDGKQDLVNGSGALYTHLSDGKGFGGPSWSGGGGWVSTGKTMTTLDANGDGKQDLLAFGSTSGPSYTWMSQYGSDLMTTVTLPTGGTINVTYTPAAQVPGAVPTSSSYPDSVANTSPRPLVTTITTKSGYGSTDIVTNYSYANGRYTSGTKDKVFDLGFQTVTKTTTSASTVTTTYNQTPQLRGLESVSVTSDPTDANKQYSQVNTTYFTPTSVPGSTFIAPSKIITRQYAGQLTPRRTRKDFDYDGNGNLIKTDFYPMVDYAAGTYPPIATDGQPADQAMIRELYEYASGTSTPNCVFLPSKKTVQTYNEAHVLGTASQTKFYYDGLSLGSLSSGLVSRIEASIDDTSSADTTFVYDAWGNVLETRDPRVNAFEYSGATETKTYDADYHAQLKTSANALLQTTAVEYDALGRPTTVTDPNAQMTKSQYDVFGRITANVLPLDTEASPTETTAYTDATSTLPASVHTTRKTSGSASLETYQYLDGLGRVIQIKRSGVGGWIGQDWFYDGSGRVSFVSISYLASASSYTSADHSKSAHAGLAYSYDPQDRVVQVTQPDGSTVKTIFAPGVTTTVDENDHATQTEDNGNVIIQRRLTGDYTAYTAGSAVTVYSTTTTRTYRGKTTVTDNAGNMTSTTFDGLGRRTGYSDPDMGSWSYSYDPNGNLATQTDPQNRTINYAYDRLNRITGKFSSADATVAANYTYDEAGHGSAKGRLTTVTYNRGSDSYVYDERGRLTSQTTTLDSITRTLGKSYDSADRVTEIDMPDGETVTPAYGADGNLVSLTSPSTTYVSAATYTPLGKLGSITYGNGVTTTYSYYDDATTDPFTNKARSYRLRQIQAGTAGVVLNQSYSYDLAGNVHAKTDANDVNRDETFGYDHYGRLVLATAAPAPDFYGTLAFAYDRLDNVTAKDGLTYTYDMAHPHQLQNTGATSYTYDANGNQITRSGGRTLTYDAENRITSVSDGGTYSYNQDRQRTIKTEGSKTTYYFFPEYEEEYTSGSKSDTTKYYIANNQKVAQWSTNQGLVFIHADHLGSSTRMTDASGDLVRSQGYKPYGTDSYLTSTVATKYQFTGQEKDGTGLYYYDARYYDPSIGRFIQPDPAIWSGRVFGNVKLTLAEQTNPYLYALDNPVKYTDPTGMRNEAVWSLSAIGPEGVAAAAALYLLSNLDMVKAGLDSLAGALGSLSNGNQSGDKGKEQSVKPEAGVSPPAPGMPGPEGDGKNDNKDPPSFRNSKDTAKEFGKNTKDFERNTKQEILEDARKAAKDTDNKDLGKFLKDNKNPDIAIDKKGNVWLKSQKTGDEINTGLPKSGYTD